MFLWGKTVSWAPFLKCEWDQKWTGQGPCSVDWRPLGDVEIRPFRQQWGALCGNHNSGCLSGACKALYTNVLIYSHTSVTTASSSSLIRLGADTPLPVSLSSWTVIKWQLERNREKEQELGGRVGWGARPWTTEVCRSRRFLVGRVVLASTEW